MIEASVIIPTYNRAERLRACLEALGRQTQLATDFEVVVVVDGSTDTTHQMLAELKTPYLLRAIWQPNGGQCAALNNGAAAAHGPVCIFLDDDIMASPQLVAEHLRLHQGREGVVGIGQLTLTLLTDADWFAHCFAQDWHAHYALLNRRERQPDWDDCYGGNMSVPRSAFLEVGGNAVDLRRNYDFELAYRLQRHGLSLVYLAAAVGTQDERKDFLALTADSEEAGAASLELYRRHPSMLPKLLGDFSAAPLRVTFAWRLLLALRISPRGLERGSRILGKRIQTYWWYRFLHRYSFWRGVRKAIPNHEIWQRLIYSTPILMYHAFQASGKSSSRFTVSARRFALQMAWLKWMGYSVISLEEYLRYRHEFRLPPTGSVVITIDDGYADNWAVAFPILRRYRYPATIFLVSDYTEGANHWDQRSELAARPLLSWSNVREMIENGIQFGAHTRTHPALTTIPLEQARAEIAGSRQALERKLGVSISVFSYPYGDHNSSVQGLAEQAGFLGSCTALPGLNTPMTPLHALRRIEIWGDDSLIQFALAVCFGQRIQTLWKWIWRARLEPEPASVKELNC